MFNYYKRILILKRENDALKDENRRLKDDLDRAYTKIAQFDLYSICPELTSFDLGVALKRNREFCVRGVLYE